MRNTVWVLLVGAIVTLVVGVLTADGWPGYLVGAILSVSLWVSVFAGQAARGVDPRVYAGAAVVAVLLGYVLFVTVGDGESAVWWAVGFILAGVVGPFAGRAGRTGTADPAGRADDGHGATGV